MLCKRSVSHHAVSVCVSVRLSVTFVDSVKTNKRIFKMFSPSGSQAILVFFLYQTAWRYSDGNPTQRGRRMQVGRQKSRFWANYIWLHCVLWTIKFFSAASAIHLAATDHSEFITLVAGKRSSLLMAGNNDEVYVWQEASTLRRRQRYAVVNLKPK